MHDIAVGNIRYHATSGAYDACVDINRQGQTYKYACVVQGSLMMQDTDVRNNLCEQAIAMAGRIGGLHSIL